MPGYSGPSTRSRHFQAGKLVQELKIGVFHSLRATTAPRIFNFWPRFGRLVFPFWCAGTYVRTYVRVCCVCCVGIGQSLSDTPPPP